MTERRGGNHGGGRTAGKKHAAPTMTKRVRIRESTLPKIYAFMKRMKLTYSDLVRDSIALYIADSDALELDHATLRAIVDIMKVTRLDSTGEAVAAAVKHYRRTLMMAISAPTHLCGCPLVPHEDGEAECPRYVIFAEDRIAVGCMDCGKLGPRRATKEEARKAWNSPEFRAV